MCAISVICDYAAKKPMEFWNDSTFSQLDLLIKQAAEFDMLTGEPKCLDPEMEEGLKKERLLARIRAYIAKVAVKEAQEISDYLEAKAAKLESRSVE